MVDVFKTVHDFNVEVIGINRSCGSIDDDKEFDFLIGSFKEEIEELIQARNDGDFVGEIDAICDLIYFAAGGLVRMGVSPEASNDIFETIHKCNMNKKKGKKDRSVEHNLDAVKPEKWVGPEYRIMEILSKLHGSSSDRLNRIKTMLGQE